MSGTPLVMEHPPQQAYLREFARREGTLTGHHLGWLREARKSAIERFAEVGFPTDRHPQWRFTDVRPIAALPFTPPTGVPPRHGLTAEGLSGAAFKAETACQLVFVDGHYAPALSVGSSLPGGRVAPLTQILDADPQRVEPYLTRYADVQRHPFAALNTAFFADGAWVHLTRGTVLDRPIHLLFVATGQGGTSVSHPRIVIVAERDTQAMILESYVGPPQHRYWTNAVTEIVLDENARLDHYTLQRQGDAAFHIALIQTVQGRASRFTSHSIALGGALARNDIVAVLDGEGAECTLNGLYMVAGRQHVDHHTLIDHAKPHGNSRELYKGVLDGQARAVFDGSIIVRPDAQKTDAMQTNKNLLLSDEAIIHTKPELKIFANDVKCKHGATIGQIAADALFYLRSRGISQKAARQLLVYAFVSEMVNRLGIESFRTGFTRWLSAQGWGTPS